MSKKIVVLKESWNLVGELTQEDKWFTITDASVIRRWGTTKGLGELAVRGPLENTILDPVPVTKFHQDSLILIIDCDEEKWK